MRLTRAADYKGLDGLYIPDGITDITINEITNCSVLSQMVNPDWTADSLGLNCATTAHIDILQPIDHLIFTGRHQLNGESIGIPNPWRNGEISMCRELKITEKFSRSEAIRLCDRWGKNQSGYEKAIAQMIRNLMESYGFRRMASHANVENQGNDAGKLSGNLLLGNTVNPLVVSKSSQAMSDGYNVSALEVVSRMVLVASEAGLLCGSDQMRVAASPRFVAHLMQEQAAHVTGCCVEKNPALSGVLLDSYGLNVLRTHFFPTKKLADGRTVEYVVMVDPSLVAAPMSMDYLEWRDQGHDIELIGNFRFDVSVLSGRGVVVAAVTFDK